MFTIYDRMYSNVPAKSTVYTLYIRMYGSGQPWHGRTVKCVRIIASSHCQYARACTLAHTHTHTHTHIHTHRRASVSVRALRRPHVPSLKFWNQSLLHTHRCVCSRNVGLGRHHWIGPPSLDWATMVGLGHHHWIGPPLLNWATIIGLGHHHWIGPPSLDWATITGLGHHRWIGPPSSRARFQHT